MIKQDRIQLNERFVRVFELLIDKGEIVLNNRNGKGMGDLAKKLLGNRAYGHIVRAFLNPDDKRVIDYSHARTLCREYGVNESFLIDGIGTPFGFTLPPSKTAQNIPTSMLGNILFTTTQALAGSGVDVGGSAKEDLEYFRIPGVGGSGLVAFPIEGNSMEPLISNGDIIICRELENIQELKDNEIYALKSDGSLWVKHVQKIENDNGQITGLKLISANHLEYNTFEEEVNEQTRLYKVIRKIGSI